MFSQVERHRDLETHRRGQGSFLQVVASRINGRQEDKKRKWKECFRHSKDLIIIVSQGKQKKSSVVTERLEQVIFRKLHEV